MELSILVLAFAGLRPADLAKCRQYNSAAPDVPSSVTLTMDDGGPTLTFQASPLAAPRKRSRRAKASLSSIAGTGQPGAI
jgi:hypothetical protein